MAQFDKNNKKHLVSIPGQGQYITVVGLQHLLADQGKSIVGMDTEILRDPFAPENYDNRQAVVRVTLHLQKGDVKAPISSLGDASSLNVNSKMKEATLRMAETRAIGRALRVATKSNYTAFEELPAEQTENTDERVA